MNAQQIETILNELKVDSLGRIRGKSKVINKIQSQHLKDLDNRLMDIRIFIAKLPTSSDTLTYLKKIDEFIYQKQVK